MAALSAADLLMEVDESSPSSPIPAAQESPATSLTKEAARFCDVCENVSNDVREDCETEICCLQTDIDRFDET